MLDTFTRKSLLGLVMSVSALSLGGCTGEGASLVIAAHETRGQSSSALVSGFAPLAPLTFQSSDGALFQIDKARVNLRDIRLDLPKGTKCESVRESLTLAQCKGGDSGSGSGTIVVPGPIVVDLLTGTTSPDISSLRLPAGDYKRIDFRIDDAKDNLPAGDELLDKSFVLRATGVDPKDVTLEVSLKFNEDARFESATGVNIEQGDSTLLTMLNPAIWMEGLPLKRCLEKGDIVVSAGVLRIDDKAKGDCSGAEDTIKRNIKRSGDLKKVK